MSLLRLQHCTVDLDRRRLVRPDGSEEVITGLDADLLRYLANHADEVVTYEDLLVEVWQFRAEHPRGVVQTALSRLRTMIDDDPKRPTHLFTVRGTGYRFALPHAAVVPAPAMGAPDLPRPATPFVGRQAELERVEAAVAAGGRLITLLGLGGLGKTRLALELALRHTGARWFADLTRCADLDDLCAAMAMALGVALDPAGDSDAAVQRIGRALAALPAGLVVLDNLEQLVEAARPAVELWLAVAPHICLLATSRRALGVAGETRLPLEPLSHDDAVALLLDRARRVAPGFDAPPEVLGAIADHLDGIPLAIELLAARAHVLSAKEMSRMLDARFAVLRRRGDGRHDNLSEVLRWSWQQLDEPARVGLAQLSVFRGGFDATAAIAVLDLPDAAPVIDVLADLADHAWLHRRDDRLQLLETIRLFAAGALDPGHAQATSARHAAWALSVAEPAAADLDGGGLAELVAHQANLSAARSWATGADPATAARLVLAEAVLVREHGGPLPALAHALDGVLGAIAGDDPRRADVLVRRASVAADLGAARQAEALLAQAIEAGARRADADMLLGHLAYLHPRGDDVNPVEAAATRYAAALEGYRAAGDVAGAYVAAYRLAYTRFLSGAYREALEALQALVVTPSPERPRTVVTQVLMAIARCQGRLGKLEDALSGFENGLDVLSDPAHRLAGECMEGIAWVHARRGRYEQALAYYEKVLVLHRRYDDRWGEGSILNDMADIHRHAGDLDAAESGYLEALRRLSSFGVRTPTVQLNLALVQLLRGRIDGARRHVADLLATALEPNWAYAAHALGLACAQADTWVEHRLALEALGERGRFVDADLATAFELAGQRALEAGRHDQAAWAWYLAAAQRHDLGDEVTAAANRRHAARAVAPKSGGQVL